MSVTQLGLTPWTIAHQAPLSMEFSRQEYWRALPFPSPRLEAETEEKKDLTWHFCGQESLRRNGVAIIVNKSLKCSTWMQSQK